VCPRFGVNTPLVVCSQVLVGEADDGARLLAQATRESIWKALEKCKPGACLSDIGAAIHEVCARKPGLGTPHYKSPCDTAKICGRVVACFFYYR